MIERIFNGNKLLAIIVKGSYKNEGIAFFTPDDFSQQLAYMYRPKGHVIVPHLHKQVARQITVTEEVLFIKSGRLRIDFYDENKTYLESRLLEKGDVILLASGGHGFEMLEPAEIIEVKQGPYLGDQDKQRFEPVNKSKLKMKREDK